LTVGIGFTGDFCSWAGSDSLAANSAISERNRMSAPAIQTVVVVPRIFRPCGLEASLLRTELHRIDTVIGILPVASCQAAASRIAFVNSDRNLPVSELHLIADQFGLVAGMLAVAGTAGLPAFLPVYMKVMQIEPAVAKIRILGRVAFAHDLLGMAGKAEGVLGGIVRRGSVGRIVGEQQLAVA